MVTIEKYYTDGKNAAAALTASRDGDEYRMGLMYNTQSGDSVRLSIEGTEEFRIFASSVIGLLTAMMED